MPRRMPQSLRVFNVDVMDTALLEQLALDSIDRFSHTTQLPGGFWSMSFVLPASEGIYWDWRINRLLSRIRLEEDGGKIIWEGRVEDVELLDLWTLRLTAYGYWSNFTDSYYSGTYSDLNYTTRRGDYILKDLRDNGLHTDTDQLSTSNAQITDPGIDLTVDYRLDWDLWRILTDSNKGLLTFGNSSNKLMDLAIWDDRIIHYKARNPTAITWQSYVGSQRGGGVRDLGARVSWRNLANAVSATYLSAGAATRTAFGVNQASIDKYIRRERRIVDSGESNATSANARRDTELEKRKDPQQETDNLVITQVWDTNGVEYPLCRVRAGDVIRIPDFTPKTGALDAVTLDGYRVFFVEETTCDHQHGELRIRPDREGQTLSAILGRNQIR